MDSDEDRALRRQIIDEVSLLVARAEREGAMILVLIEAKRIRDKYPSNPMPLSKIEDAITRLAMERKLSVRFS